MTLEEEFKAELAQRYEGDGWEVQSSEDAVPILNFRPDLLLRRGAEHLVVEVKRTGFTSTRAVELTKKAVESNENWRFALKLIPPGREQKAHRPARRDIEDRVKIAQRLALDGFHSEAFILLSTSIEANLRELLAAEDILPPISTASLLRDAYEEGIISDVELHRLQGALEVRNRLVHGFAVTDAKQETEELTRLATGLADRLNPCAAA